MTTPRFVIGTRGSDLALYQANFIRKKLESGHGCTVEIKIIKTTGDRVENLSFDKMEGKGFFTKELEEALLDGRIDLAVHSLKDLMTTQPDGLCLGAVGFRADRRELLLIREEFSQGSNLLPVKAGGVIGTSSARRKCQIAVHNSSLRIEDLRGNVPTRVRKLREGEYDAIIIAAAGVRRLELDLSGLKEIELDPESFLPAPAQGILGIQIRSDDGSPTSAIVGKLNSKQDQTQAALERGLLAKFDSGCSLPLGVLSEVDGKRMRLKAVLGILDGDGWSELREAEVTGSDPEKIVDEAFLMLNKGGG